MFFCCQCGDKFRFYIIEIKERKLGQDRPNRCVEPNRYHERPTSNRQAETQNNMNII